MDKKWNLQDIKSSNNKQPNVPISSTNIDVRKDSTVNNEEVVSDTPANSTYTSKSSSRPEATHKQPQTSMARNKKRPVFLKIIFPTLIAAVLLFFVFGYMSAKTSLTILPRTNTPTLNTEVTAYLTPDNTQLGYELLSLEAEGERQVTASGETEDVAVAAEGTITIYKTTAGEQRLIATTRFEDPDGRIYRITDGVSVPGGTPDEPGSITVGIAADEAGEEYNAPANTRFTVPGLESDTALFNAIYATNAAAFTGGFEGTRVVVEESDLEAAQTAIREELQGALVGRIASERPADFVSFANTEKFAYEALPASEGTSGTALVKEKVTLQVPVFRKDDFASFLARSLVTGYEGGPVRVEDYSVIDFAYTASTSELATLGETDSITFTLSGRPLLVWEYDETTLKTDLLGASQSALPTILASYPAIERAEATFKPFWRKSFPDAAAKISLEEVLEWPE